MTDGWRIEADDEWLASHSSDTFARIRRRMRRVGLLGDAISNAELGPFGGAPRKPELSIGHKAYAVVRYVHHRFAYTVIQVDLERCRRCGRRLLEVHRMLTVREDGRSRPVGVVRVCRSCGADSWMFFSRMPHTVRARRRGRNVVL
ncbi:MAG: hypothetical protein J2P15_05475 [Micromonosporaceae bacterium]|nr:hypothetical protein [Micromonosporaceae bacterium]